MTASRDATLVMVRCLSAGPDDIPKTGSSEVFGQVLFAKEKVEYHGQILGLIVAESQVSNNCAPF